MKILVVVDMQNDFIDGALGNDECKAVVSNVVEKINNFNGDEIFYTLDTHQKNYLETQEGKKLPVVHCIEYTPGWMLNKDVDVVIRKNNAHVTEIRKPTFGSVTLVKNLYDKLEREEELEIELVGVCTDICVISNAMLIKAFLPEVKVVVDASCCAGVTPESHKTALEAMKMCHIEVINE